MLSDKQGLSSEKWMSAGRARSQACTQKTYSFGRSGPTLQNPQQNKLAQKAASGIKILAAKRAISAVGSLASTGYTATEKQGKVLQIRMLI